MSNCYLIGEDHLVIQCADILQARGFIVAGMISSLTEVHEWANKKEIRYFPSLKAAKRILQHAEFDYLFSVVNNKIIPPNLLARARRFAINYHDAPLPRYAGVHATCWAILAGEKTHGVTWHIMNDVIDGGDILKQNIFTLDAAETAFSLNVKCYQQAAKLFSELVDELAQGSEQRSAQNLPARTYYSYKKKPIGNGWIGWQHAAKKIDRFFRACYLGHYRNTFSLLKFKLGNDIFIINQLQLTQEKSTHPPGTLVNIANNRWQIATLTQDVMLLRISTPQGKNCPLPELIQQYQLQAGEILSSPTPTERMMFKKISMDAFTSEAFWVKKHLRFQTAGFPFLPSVVCGGLTRKFTCVDFWQVTTELTQQFRSNVNTESSFSNILLTIWLIYLYRLGNQKNTGIGFNYPLLHEISDKLNNFIASSIPFDIQLNDDMNFLAVLQQVEILRIEVEKAGNYLSDIFCRYTELANNISVIPITALIVKKIELNSNEQYPKTFLIFKISEQEKKIAWFIDNACIKESLHLATIANNLTRHFETLFVAIMNNAAMKIKNLPILPLEERQKILLEWNNTKTAFPAHKSIAQLFEEQAIDTPTLMAVSDQYGFLNYKELNEKSNQLARFFLKNGMLPGALVLVCGNASCQLIANILAILKVGATYIPLDPQVPSHKIGIILENSKPNIIVTTKTYAADFFSENKVAKIICIEDSFILSADENNKNLNTIHSASSIAYIMYTSGTTGTPKGVMVSHYSVSRLVKHTNYIQITQGERVAQAASISFDASTFEIWGALLNGATLVCASRCVLLSPIKFADFLQEKTISVLWLTAELFNHYVSIQPSMFKKLTYLLIGGDVLAPAKIKMVLECPAGSPKWLINGYGPTENTTFTTAYLITKEAVEQNRIPIGKPIANTTVYVLDNNLEPTPIGATGELYTGGSGLANGYLNNLELTQQNFISSPFREGEKLYKTGDIVRWLPDGNLDYIGRKDRQVKIRGFRIEIEALQTHLSRYSSVSQCYILPYEDHKLGKLLVAYIVPSPGKKADIKNLQAVIAEKLPEYMIPDFFVLLKKLPLTENGKVDQAFLPRPNIRNCINKKDYMRPRNKIEKELAAILSNLFSIKKIGINDDFFNLGGNSLLLTKFILAVKKKFNFEISLPVFFKKSTIACLSEEIVKKNVAQHPNQEADLVLQDSQLDLMINANKAKKITRRFDNVLLTGATGFLGVRLLYDLYCKSNAKIYCLVRAPTIFFAKNALRRSLAKYKLYIPLDDRIVLVMGDLSAPSFGLPEKKFLFLAEEIDVIYHNAAHVHHIYNYEMLRFTNVLGTVEVIKLASLSKIKPIHYVSTLSAVLNYTDPDGRIIEDYVSEDSRHDFLDGYSQTKLVAEKLLAEASARGLPNKIYRPGWILERPYGDIAITSKNHLLLLIKGCLQIGYAPDWECRLNILPVDFVSKLIIEISLNLKIKDNVFNFTNNNFITWIELIRNLKGNRKIVIVPEKTWRDRYLRKLSKDNAIFSLLPIYINEDPTWVGNLDKICEAKDLNTQLALEEVGLSYPNVRKTFLPTLYPLFQREDLHNMHTCIRL